MRQEHKTATNAVVPRQHLIYRLQDPREVNQALYVRYTSAPLLQPTVLPLLSRFCFEAGDEGSFERWERNHLEFSKVQITCF